MSKLEKAKTIIKENLKDGDCGLFVTLNSGSDNMFTIYKKDGLQIDICYRRSYFEVRGLSSSELYELLIYYNQLRKKLWSSRVSKRKYKEVYNDR